MTNNDCVGKGWHRMIYGENPRVELLGRSDEDDRVVVRMLHSDLMALAKLSRLIDNSEPGAEVRFNSVFDFIEQLVAAGEGQDRKQFARPVVEVTHSVRVKRGDEASR